MKSNLIFNPFTKIAGLQALAIGLAGMIVAGVIGFYSHTHFDGVLNIHSGLESTIFIHLLWPFVDVLFLGIWFSVFGLILSSSKVRLIDIFGTQAFAFLPLVPASLLGFSKSIERFTATLMGADPKNIQWDVFPIDDLLMVIAIGLVTVTLTVWSGVWIYNGFKLSANLPHKKVIPVFIIGVLVGMFLPKFLVMNLFLN